jgi:hypothetical protein
VDLASYDAIAEQLRYARIFHSDIEEALPVSSRSLLSIFIVCLQSMQVIKSSNRLRSSFICAMFTAAVPSQMENSCACGSVTLQDPAALLCQFAIVSKGHAYFSRLQLTHGASPNRFNPNPDLSVPMRFSVPPSGREQRNRGNGAGLTAAYCAAANKRPYYLRQ